MTTLKKSVTFLAATLFACAGYTNEIIVKAKDLAEIQNLSLGRTLNDLNSNLEIEEVFPELGLYKIKSKPHAVRFLNQKAQLVSELQKTLQVNGHRTAQVEATSFVDAMMTLRQAAPSDTNFDKQWGVNESLGDYSIFPNAAWDITTGGENALGQEIVIAVVDGGFDLNHRDLQGNLWVNTGEIAGNGVDDDGNGYIDDIHGWNVRSKSGQIQNGTHGTHVAGIIGASGDNTLQVTGVNWNVKVMMVSAGRSLAQTSATMRAYSYILKQKKLWVESNGKQGANVVAINSSFGIDLADCSSNQYNTWNDMFDELGKFGILSVAATANRSYNVDVRGDVPTGCTSPYVVAVTNSTIGGNRNSSAAYGIESIDLAAPGTRILSTVKDNRIANLTGTSMATPHVAGAIGLLHSAASKDFVEFFNAEPSKGALYIKDLMISSVTSISKMKSETVSGGILNLGNAAKEINAYSSDDSGDDGNTPEEPKEEPGEDPGEEEPSDNEEPNEEEPETVTFENTKLTKIPDAFFSNGVVSSSLNLPSVEDPTQMSITVSLRHDDLSDVMLKLRAPNGKTITLARRVNKSGTKATVSFDASNTTGFAKLGKQSKGKWHLVVEDQNWLDTGYLTGWSISVKK